MTLDDILSKLKHAPFCFNVNKLKIPVTVYNTDYAGKDAWNKIYKQVIKNKKYELITRTHSNGISLRKKLSSKIYQYDVTMSTSCLELTIINPNGMWRIQFRHKGKTVSQIKGHKAFIKFKEICKEHDIDLDTYKVKNGKEIKTEIEKPMIKLERIIFKDIIFENAHHIDYHSSYPAGLVNTHPEFKDVVTYLYNKRHDNEFYKAILNYSIGYMQSVGGCQARYSTLARDAINDNNDRIRTLAEKIKGTGRVVIAYNVDGIWYSGKLYHGEGEGNNLGDWTNDHVNCKLRFKSNGCYEFIENGTYHPVVRGYTKLDQVKPRELWKWGDIYSKDFILVNFYFIDGEGILDEEEQIQQLERTIQEI